MLASEGERLLLHVKRCGVFNLVLSFLDVGYRAVFLDQREGTLHGLDVVFLEFATDDGVVVPVDECVLLGLILQDAHLGVDIVLHLVVVAVEMVGGDVEQHGNIGAEVVHVVELERREFDDVVFMWVFSHLQSQRTSDVSGQSHVVACLAEDVIDE